MDDKDRHVLAAALSAGADLLLTQNTKHFPRAWMSTHGIQLINASELLIRLVKEFPEQVAAAHEKTVRLSSRPESDILMTLERIVGVQTAQTFRDAIRRAQD